ncbi:hypothetical protein [Streptomyces sp. NPDC088733]|uniref:hypothetical protein n=1 Tax=Streptomyces sp. NPDC088733 TaxID=3365880 RepID=UPI00382EA6E5
MSSKARWITVAAAAATVGCLTASAVAAPSPGPAKAGAATAVEAKVKPGTSGTAAEAEKAKKAGKPGKPGGPEEDRARIAASLAKGIAARLSVSLASAQEAVKELFALADGPGGGTDPNSRQFAAVAGKLGATPAELEKALTETKRAIGGHVEGGKHGGEGKPGDGKTVIKHAGSDGDEAVKLFAAGVATRLGVGTAAAERAVRELFTQAGRPGGIEVGSTKFRAIAKELGVSAARFEKALSGTKQELAAQGPSTKG